MNNFPHIPEAEQQKRWFCLWKAIIDKLIISKDCNESDLIILLNKEQGTDLFPANWQTLKHITEFALSEAKNANKIFSKIPASIKLNQNGPAGTNKSIIEALFAEIQTIPLLSVLNFQNITYVEEGIDFEAKLDDSIYVIEATYITGPNFKTQTVVHSENCNNSESCLYLIITHKLIHFLKRKYQAKEEQVLKHGHSRSNSIIIILTNLFETHPFWLEAQPHECKHPIQSFVDACEIPTIVFGSGLNLYVSEKLSSALPMFDKNRYLELAYGFDVKNLDLKVAEDKAKAEEAFWNGYKSVR